eukprot:Gb_41646 [translate_table: standard]
MGNYISCASSRVPPSDSVKVVVWKGSGGGVVIKEYERRIKAAEVMMQNPQQFVCHSESLQVGRRVDQALSADDDLELGNLYFLLPMHRLHTLLSASDMPSLKPISNSNSNSNSAKVLPLSLESPRPLPPQNSKECYEQEECYQLLTDDNCPTTHYVLPRMNLQDIPDLQMAFATFRLHSCRSWKPRLETINEARPKLRDLMQCN